MLPCHLKSLDHHGLLAVLSHALPPKSLPRRQSHPAFRYHQPPKTERALVTNSPAMSRRGGTDSLSYFSSSIFARANSTHCRNTSVCFCPVFFTISLMRLASGVRSRRYNVSFAGPPALTLNAILSLFLQWPNDSLSVDFWSIVTPAPSLAWPSPEPHPPGWPSAASQTSWLR